MESAIPGQAPAIRFGPEHLHELGRPEARGRAKRRVTAYLRRFTYDTITHSAGALRFLVDTVGADRVMPGSDFCFDMGYERPRAIIGNLGLGSADRRRILRDDARQLLRLA